MKFHIFGIMLAVVVCVAPLHAQVIWDGSEGDGLWNTGDNWVDGTPPTNSDWLGHAQFDATGTPTTITRGSSTSINSVAFLTAGWTITGQQFNVLRTISSAGAGTNTFGVRLEAYGNRTWTIASGNTLHFTNQLYFKEYSILLAGGGTAIIDNTIGGYSTVGLRIADTMVIINNSSLFTGGTGSDSAVILEEADSVLRVLATVSEVNNLIANDRIVDNTGLGFSVTDFGGGYTQIAVVPEPATSALLLGGLGAVLMTARRRRR